MCNAEDKEKCHNTFVTAMKLVIDGYSREDEKIIVSINKIIDILEKQTKTFNNLIVKVNALEQENAKLKYQIDELKRMR